MQTIPLKVISLLAELLPKYETHASLNSIFLYADIENTFPELSKLNRVQETLIHINKANPNPLKILGKVLEKYFDGAVISPHDPEWFSSQLDKITQALAENSLMYIKGGRINGSLTAPTKSLENFINDLDIPAIDQEFTRALTHVDSSPREAVSAASNILESICKVYIEENQLNMPNKKDLKNLFDVVRKSLNINREAVEDEDLKRIISGIISVVDGIASLRTHSSSAHGAGIKQYNLRPRHARLAIHSAHTIGLFILESWKEK